MPLKVAIIKHGYVPPYRVRFYEMLNERGDDQYVIFHGEAPSMSGSTGAEGPFAFPTQWCHSYELRLPGWTPIYQPVIRSVLSGGYDAVVFGLEVKFIANVFLALLCKLRGIPVLYWDFGYHQRLGGNFGAVTPGLMFRLGGAAKDFLTRLADGYMTYTKRGAERLGEIGFPRDRTFVLQNTIDITEQIAVHDQLRSADDAQLRQELGLQPDSVVFLYIGRLVGAKRVDLLIEAVQRIERENLCSRPVQALIMGAGPEQESLQAQAQGNAAIHFLGDIRDPMVIARYMKVSAAVVLPGFVGLAVNHALAQGRPVITRDHELHSPEIEYLVHDQNGLLIPGGTDDFVTVMAQFAGSPEWQQRLADGALRSREGLRLETMAERFVIAVRKIVALRSRRAPISANGASARP